MGGLGIFVFGLVTIIFSIVHNRTTFLDWISCLVASIIGLFFIVGVAGMIKIGFLRIKQKKSWLKASAMAQTTIAERGEDQDDSEYARVYGNPDKYWCLKLKMLPNQLAIKPEETLVSVSINESQYKKYEGRISVIIYSSIEDPFVFLLEDEI